MKLSSFRSQYSYLDTLELGEIRTLTLSDSPMRIIQVSYLPLAFVVDNILVVQITPPEPPLGLSQHELNQYMTSVNKKITTLLSEISTFRKDHYILKQNYPKRFSSEDYNCRFAPVERDFFLIRKLSKWIEDELSLKLKSEAQKKTWLDKMRKCGNLLHKTLSVGMDYKNPVLYYLQELYLSYSLEEEMFSVGHALERLSLPGIQVFKKTYDKGFSNDEHTIGALDLEIAFRMQILKIAYASLESQKLPDNTTDLETAFRAFYLHVVKWTLIKTLQNQFDLQEPFSQIPADSPFWEETTLTKSWWDFIVKTLNPQICVYTLPRSQPSYAQ